MYRELNAIGAIALRDFTKFRRDRTRILATFMFPLIFIGVLGGSLQSNLGSELGYNFLTFVFIGVLGQTLFQSTASGIISLVEDRENDFSQEMFVSPVSRYTIIIGKIVGESSVALTQALGVIILGLIIGVPFTLLGIIKLLPIAVIVCLFGGAFGVLVLANLSGQKAANQLFPFLILPQFFLAGVFNPIKTLPPVLLFLSRIAPMTYAVDFFRSVYYFGQPEYSKVVVFSPLVNITVIAVLFTIFVTSGTYLFVRNERNK
ncbi:ABC transporter permease [Candidatus Microgenomates bacterium]|nr:MAG: ABC transporter permease [Candidatus Microgenomates bacterium]